MKNSEVIKLYQGLNKLRESDKTFPVKVGFAIARNINKITPTVEDFEKARMDIIQANCTPSDDGITYYADTQEKREYVNKELTDLSEVDNCDIKLHKIFLSDIENMSLSIEEIEALYLMIEDGEE